MTRKPEKKKQTPPKKRKEVDKLLRGMERRLGKLAKMSLQNQKELARMEEFGVIY